MKIFTRLVSVNQPTFLQNLIREIKNTFFHKKTLEIIKVLSYKTIKVLNKFLKKSFDVKKNIYYTKSA
jgi:hypothetical protein